MPELDPESAEGNYAVGRHGGESGRDRSVVQRNTGTLLPEANGIERGRIDVLLQQHRQVLGHGMSEVRAEHSDVVAASISHPDDGLRVSW